MGFNFFVSFDRCPPRVKMKRRNYTPTRWPTFNCLGAINWLRSTISLAFAVSCLVLFLYVLPPWKIKTIADAVWSTGGAVVGVVHKVATEEQKAQQFLAQLTKSGREIWASVQDSVPEPVVSIG